MLVIYNTKDETQRPKKKPFLAIFPKYDIFKLNFWYIMYWKVTFLYQILQLFCNILWEKKIFESATFKNGKKNIVVILMQCAPCGAPPRPHGPLSSLSEPMAEAPSPSSHRGHCTPHMAHGVNTLEIWTDHSRPNIPLTLHCHCVLLGTNSLWKKTGPHQVTWD